MSLSAELVTGLWVILPAYIANASAPYSEGETVIDGGATFRGERLLGDGKTWEGFFFAVAIGVVAGFIEGFFHPFLTPFTAARDVVLPQMTVLAALLVSLGAMTGDVVGSFFKRQSGLPRGEPAPLLDQLDFVVGGFIFVMPVIDFNLTAAVLVVAFTPLLHLATNLISYKLGHKEVPW